MNERIKQLLIESGFRIFGDKVVAGDFGSSGNATLCSQKFADLLIKECARVVDALTEMDNPIEYRNTHVTGADVLEHFGVQE